MKFRTGVYLHYKGNKYLALGLAKHSDTAESRIWVRPLKMFLESVKVEEKKIPRFKFLNS